MVEDVQERTVVGGGIEVVVGWSGMDEGRREGVEREFRGEGQWMGAGQEMVVM